METPIVHRRFLCRLVTPSLAFYGVPVQPPNRLDHLPISSLVEFDCETPKEASMMGDGNEASEVSSSNSLETTRELLKLGERPDGLRKPLRITKKALVAANEVLRHFAEEAQHRAGIEAECDHEANREETADEMIPIRADHITKVAAELIFDFAT